MTLKGMIDLVFSHNQLVRIWLIKKGWYDYVVWEGMAHEIPEQYLDREATIFGVYGAGKEYSDYINIRMEETL